MLSRVKLAKLLTSFFPTSIHTARRDRVNRMGRGREGKMENEQKRQIWDESENDAAEFE